MLIVAAASRGCAIPLEHVVETMRPLPIAPMAGLPPFMLGLSIIRGEPVGVVDLPQLLQRDGVRVALRRFVTVKAGDRCIALAVESVAGLADLEEIAAHELPSLLRDTETALVDAIAVRDKELLMILRATQIVPPEILAMLPAGVGAA